MKISSPLPAAEPLVQPLNPWYHKKKELYFEPALLASAGFFGPQREESTMQDYRTIQGTSTANLESKHSKFIGHAAFVETEEAALEVLAQVRAANRTANHNVYAYVLRQDSRLRYSDDGEPAKTAGLPVLESIQHAGLTDCIVVVTRYFGGTLLGTGGLVRAYTDTASAALQAAKVVTVRSVVKLALPVDYSLYEQAVRLIQAAGAALDEPQFTDRVTLTFTMPEGTQAPLLPQLSELTRGQAKVEVSDPFYAPF